MKKALFLFFSILMVFSSKAQLKMEHLTTDWPPEYKWQIIKRQNSGSKQSITIIPGYQISSNATIIGNIVAYRGMHYASLDSLMVHYKSVLDTGSVLTVIERGDKDLNPWILFKVETPKTDKYPEPESDLYYDVQGEYALFENYVAIKEPNLSSDFVKKWSTIFKNSKISKD